MVNPDKNDNYRRKAGGFKCSGLVARTSNGECSSSYNEHDADSAGHAFVVLGFYANASITDLDGVVFATRDGYEE